VCAYLKVMDRITGASLLWLFSSSSSAMMKDTAGLENGFSKTPSLSSLLERKS